MQAVHGTLWMWKKEYNKLFKGLCGAIITRSSAYTRVTVRVRLFREGNVDLTPESSAGPVRHDI